MNAPRNAGLSFPCVIVLHNEAAELNNHPLTIHNWVRNNIEYLPTYGSIQGSDLTLLSKRGNAFDTASLLIALYRAANIPARYVYGTVELQVDQAMNWVGREIGSEEK